MQNNLKVLGSKIIKEHKQDGKNRPRSPICYGRGAVQTSKTKPTSLMIHSNAHLYTTRLEIVEMF